MLLLAVLLLAFSAVYSTIFFSLSTYFSIVFKATSVSSSLPQMLKIPGASKSTPKVCPLRWKTTIRNLVWFPFFDIGGSINLWSNPYAGKSWESPLAAGKTKAKGRFKWSSSKFSNHSLASGSSSSYSSNWGFENLV